MDHNGGLLLDYDEARRLATLFNLNVGEGRVVVYLSLMHYFGVNMHTSQFEYKKSS